MRTPESHHETDFTAHAKSNAVSELVIAPSAGAENEDVPERHRTREDLEKALNEAKKSAAHLRKIIDTIPTLAWCNLSDGSNEFVNQRWCDYTGLSPEEVQRVGCKVAIHPEDLPKWLDEWRTLVESVFRHTTVFRHEIVATPRLQLFLFSPSVMVVIVF